MKLSKYSRIIPYNDDEVILYDTICHSVVTLPANYVNHSELSDDCDEDTVAVLKEMGHFVSEQDVSAKIIDYVINSEKLFISIELNLNCNLRCPYCYQAGTRSSELIKIETLDLLMSYFKRVYCEKSFKELDIKILGGEPTLAWDRFMYIYEKARCFCLEKNIKFCVLIDTNGTNIDGILELKGYSSLLLTVPLTQKGCHDSVRFNANGNGTYDDIICNLNTLYLSGKNIKVVLRYNVDANNINCFEEYLSDLRNSLKFVPLISVNYTAELNGGTEFANKLTYADFVKWSSTNAIDLLISAELPITISPNISIEECQFRSKYSLKVFSDDTAGSCAMSYFDDKRETIKEVLEQFNETGFFWKAKAKQTLLSDQKCMICCSLFLCGGTKKLPCIQALDDSPCERDGKHSILLDEFLKRYVYYQNEGKGNLFVVFENGESFR